MNRPKLKQISIATFVSLGMLSTSSIAANDIVKIDGSSTVYPITEAVAEEFQIATRIKVTVGVSGTGGGFKKFCRGETAVSNASRPIKLNEIKRCKESGIKFIELPIAYDALSVVINKKNDWAKEMTLSELKKMWEPAAQGKIMKWNQIRAGWPDAPLRLYGPEAVIEESKAIRGDFTASEDDNVLVKGVSGDKGGIAYFGLAYYEENKNLLSAVAIKNSTGNFVLPSLKTIMNGSYNPLSRPLFIYLNAEKVKSDPNVKKFVEFYLKYAAELSKEVGYVPFSKEEYAAITNHYKTLQTGSAYKEPKIGLSVKEILELSAANN